MIDLREPQYTCTLLDNLQPDVGNILFLVEAPEWTRVLKIYRARSGRLAELLRAASHRLFERKTGASPAARRATERELLRLWKEAGVDVPAVLDDEAPAGMPLSSWFEYCPGPMLSAWAATATCDQIEDVVRRLAREDGRRFALAAERDDPRLLSEHSTWNHVLVSGERLVHFDLEVGYRRGFDTLLAIALDLAGTLRSIQRAPAVDLTDAMDAYLDAADQDTLLARASDRYLSAADLGTRLRRDRDRRARGDSSKSGVLEALRARLAARGASLSDRGAGTPRREPQDVAQ